MHFYNSVYVNYCAQGETENINFDLFWSELSKHFPKDGLEKFTLKATAYKIVHNGATFNLFRFLALEQV